MTCHPPNLFSIRIGTLAVFFLGPFFCVSLLSQEADSDAIVGTSQEPERSSLIPGCLVALEAIDQEVRSMLKQYPGWSCGIERVVESISPEIRQRTRESWYHFLGWLDGGVSDNPKEAARQLFLWGQTAHTVFVACAPLHGEDFEPVWQDFRNIETLLDKIPDHVSVESRIEAFLPVVSYLLNTRLSDHQSVLLPWMQAFGNRIMDTPSTSLHKAWLDIRAFSGLALIGPQSDSAAEGLARQWMLEFFQQSSVSLRHRLFLAHMQVMAYHTYGRSKDALEHLDWLAELEPASRAHPGLLGQHFYVLHSGVGDRRAARNILDEFDSLVAAGVLDPEDKNFGFITDTYYKTLPMCEISFRRMTVQGRNLEQTTTAR